MFLKEHVKDCFFMLRANVKQAWLIDKEWAQISHTIKLADTIRRIPSYATCATLQAQRQKLSHQLQ